MSDSGGLESAKNGKSSDEEPLTKKKTPSKKSKGSEKTKSKKGRKKANVSFAEDPVESDDKSEEEYEVEAIVAHRFHNGKLAYKIRWKNYSANQDTWEPHGSLTCPDILDKYNKKNDIKVPGKLAKPTKGESSKGRKRRSSVSDQDNGGGNDEYEVYRIVEAQVKRNGTREFLVQWKHWSSEYNTWEPEANLNCPELIEKFMKNYEHVDQKELRVGRKHTERFTLSTRDSGRRLSKRNTQTQRVKYYDADDDE